MSEKIKPEDLPKPKKNKPSASMTMRDEYALSLANGFIAHSGFPANPVEFASMSYRLADELLAARDVK